MFPSNLDHEEENYELTLGEISMLESQFEPFDIKPGNYRTIFSV